MLITTNAGIPIEGEFIKSWDSIEHFYDRMQFPFVPKVRSLIAQMRQNGYDRFLRAGQSLWALIVSRSRRHGLRGDQPMIAFWFRSDGMDVYINLDKQVKITYPDIGFTPEIDALSEEPLKRAID